MLDSLHMLLISDLPILTLILPIKSSPRSMRATMRTHPIELSQTILLWDPSRRGAHSFNGNVGVVVWTVHALSGVGRGGDKVGFAAKLLDGNYKIVVLLFAGSLVVGRGEGDEGGEEEGQGELHYSRYVINRAG